MMDTYPAMLQIMETARGDLPVGAQGLQFPPASKEWQALVRAGVVEALCSWILNVRIHPDTPKEQMAVSHLCFDLLVLLIFFCF